MIQTRLRGVLAPMATTFDRATGDVDRAAIAANVGWWMRSRLAGLLVLGSNGESGLLDEAECDAVIATVRHEMPRDRVLLAGTGRESTRATIAASLRAANLGADAVLVRTPSFFKGQMSADALVAYFTAVADASPVPVLLYHLPGVTGVTMTLPTVARLAEHPNIAGMKETSNDLERMGQFATVRPGQFALMCGVGPVAYPGLASGATGAILAAANVVPDAFVSLYDHVRAGRHEDALALQQRLTPLAQLVTSVYGVAGLKAALDMAGAQGGPVRPPLLPVSLAGHAEIAAALRTATQSS